MIDDIKNNDCSLPKWKVKLIFELSKNKIFIHNKYTSKGNRSVRGYEPNYRKIANELDISSSSVRAYINLLHCKIRENRKKQTVKEKEKVYAETYRQKPETKEKIMEWSKKHLQKTGVRERRKKYFEEYSKKTYVKELRKVYKKTYRQKPETKEKEKEYSKIYAKRPAVKQKRREYEQIPKVRERIRKYNNKSYQKNKKKHDA